MREQPGERQLQQRSPPGFRELSESFDLFEIFLGEKLGVPLVSGDPCVLRYRLSLSIFSRQQTAHERKERKKRQLLALAFGQNLFFRFTVQQAVLVLHADE